MDIYRAAHTFYTFRDIRDVLVSRYRMFNKEPEMGIVKYYIEQDVFAKKNADLVLKYEDMLLEVEETVNLIANILKVDVSAKEIIAQLPDSKNEKGKDNYHSPDTLL
ncbi:MAG: hypothetical protein ACOC2U_02685, partial [bacterium]